MPFKSSAQRKYLFAKHPEIAKRWAKEEKQEHKEHPWASPNTIKKIVSDHMSAFLPAGKNPGEKATRKYVRK